MKLSKDLNGNILEVNWLKWPTWLTKSNQDQTSKSFAGVGKSLIVFTKLFEWSDICLSPMGSYHRCT